MGQEDDGLGLSLSLRCPESQNQDRQPPVVASFPANLRRSPLRFLPQHKTSDLNAENTGLHYPGIDVNFQIVVADCDEDVMVSSPNSTVSSLSGKRSEREDNDGERPSSSLEIDDDGGVTADGRKKLRLSKEQMAVLEDAFKEHNTLGPKHKMALANQLNLRPRQVEVWFQNRRARTKLKQTEVECEYLRRCCENLKEENRRLHKEVTELRALKLSPQRFANMSPPTTLTMCPQCERVAAAAGRHQLPPFGSWAAVIPPQALKTHPPKEVIFVSKSKMM